MTQSQTRASTPLTYQIRRGPWTPLLPETMRLRAQAALRGIFDTLPSPKDISVDSSMSSGHAGMALLHGYAALAESAPQESHHFRIAREHLEQAIERLGYLANNPWFFSGYSGVAWTVDHFIHMGLVEEGDEDLNDEIDKALMDFLSHDPWIGLPELIAGAAGIGLYGLDRGGRGRGPEIVRRVIDILFQKAEQTPHGIAWFDPPELLHYVSRERHPNGFFNLGTSHGNPGVIGFLAEAAYRGDVRARALLDASMSWLLACRDLFQDGSLFGTGFARGEKTNAHGSRLSWCYGDLGISEVILLAARRTGNPSWEIEALKVAGACATRPNPRSAVCDAGLCHGAFGNAHLFARLYNATADAVFSGVAQNFYEMGLDLRRETPEAGGFLAFHAPRVEDPMQDTWIPKTGLLEGSAGIGLALLAATTPIEPLWDRQILAHVPPVLV